MKALGWALTAIVTGLVFSTRSSVGAIAPGKGCTPEIADRANRLRVRADAELLLPPGAASPDPVDPAELEQVAGLLDVCLPFTDPRPTVSPADELRSRAVLLKTRRGALGPPPAQKDQLGQIAEEVDALRDAADKTDPKDPTSATLLQRIGEIGRELDAIGLSSESARLARAAELLRARMGIMQAPPPTAPNPGSSAAAPAAPAAPAVPAAPAATAVTAPAPVTLPTETMGQIQAVMTIADAEPIAADMLADAIAMRFPGNVDDIRQLRRRAADLRAQRPKPTPMDGVEMLRLSARPNFVSPSTMDAVANAIASADEITAEALHHRAQEIRALRRIGE